MKIIKIIIIALSAAAAVMLSALLFFMITEYRPDSVSLIEPVYESKGTNGAPGGLRLMTWNIGYCGLDAGTDFFMEGGSQTGRSPLERQRAALDAVIETVDFQEPDICFIQEVDIKSHRSYNIDQLYTAVSGFSGHQALFALNFKSPFVPVPVKSPIGRVESGIAVFSRYSTDRAERHQLPGSYGWPVSIFHLKRCALVSRIPSPVEGKDWILINIHLTAYGDGGQRKEQLEYLKELITGFYDEGHYVVVGGDWNSMFPGVTKQQFGTYTTPEEYLFWLQEIPPGWTPENWQWCYDAEIPTCRTLEKPYRAGENFTTIIDGFLVSPNLRVDEVNGFNLRFEHTDHNPVAITVSIRN